MSNAWFNPSSTLPPHHFQLSKREGPKVFPGSILALIAFCKQLQLRIKKNKPKNKQKKN